MEKFFKKRFYPQNFILQKTGNTDSIIKQISNEAKDLSPDLFIAEVLCFNFILHYQPPYSEFTELKRLQAEAIDHTRFRYEYHGFIAIDINEWQNHFDDEFFTVILTFLDSMTDNWKYIFLLDNEKAIADFTKLLKKVIPSMGVCNINVKNFAQRDFTEGLIDEISNNHKKFVNSSAKNLLQNVFKNRVCSSDNDITDAAKDISAYFSNEIEITDSLIAEYLLNEFTYLFSHMTEEERMILSDNIIEKEDKR